MGLLMIVSRLNYNITRINTHSYLMHSKVNTLYNVFLYKKIQSLRIK